MPDPAPLEVSASETRRLLSEPEADFRLVDVRDPDEYAFCRLPGAELISLSVLPSEASVRLPDKSAHVVLYCHHGMRSLRAAQMLRALGYGRAQSMAGGIDEWSREIDPATPTY